MEGRRRTGSVLAAVIGVVSSFLLVAAAPASVTEQNRAEQDRTVEPWEPYRSEGWTAPAGKYCDFPLRLEIVEDDEWVRVLDRYPDGSVRAEEYKGTLVLDFVNADTGRRARRDASGRAWVGYRDDESMRTFTGLGPFAAGFRAEDGFARGYYLLDGFHDIRYGIDGHREMPVALGTEENMCRAVA